MRVRRGEFAKPGEYKTTRVTHSNQLRSGSAVLEKNGFVAVVYDVYTDTEISLCAEGYHSKGDMVERDGMTDISEIELIKY